MNNFKERVLYPLYPHLAGKKVLVVECVDGDMIEELKTNLESMQHMHVDVDLDSDFGSNIGWNLIPIFKEKQLDMIVIHVNSNAAVFFEETLIKTHGDGYKLLVLESSMNQTKNEYENIRKTGIPTCVKFGNEKEMTLKILNKIAVILK